MPDPYRDAFGRLIVSPEALPLEQRIDAARRGAGQIQADPHPEARWIGEGVARLLRDGGDLATILGIRPPPGSRRTAHAVIRQERVCTALLRLANQLGSDARASAVLRGLEPCPPAVRDSVGELHALGAPTSVRAFVRARKATRTGSLMS